MRITEVLFLAEIFIVATAVMAIRYKMSVRKKITGLLNKNNFLTQFPNLADFLPMETRNKQPNEVAIRKKANIALLIFYLGIVLGLILAEALKSHAVIRK